MASILKGAPIVAAMNERNAALCEQLKTKGIVPTLAVVRVGAREDDLSYERGVMTRCGKVGVEVKQYLLPADAAQDDLLKVIAEINADDAIHGCLLFRPLPRQFDDRTVRAALAPEKDIDGITDGSLAGVFTNTDLGYAPCTAQACLEILKHYNVPLSGKRAVVVGRSLVVGKPAAMMLDRENATVTICNSRTQDHDHICQEADVVVVGSGSGMSIFPTSMDGSSMITGSVTKSWTSFSTGVTTPFSSSYVMVRRIFPSSMVGAAPATMTSTLPLSPGFILPT